MLLHFAFAQLPVQVHQALRFWRAPRTPDVSRSRRMDELRKRGLGPLARRLLDHHQTPFLHVAYHQTIRLDMLANPVAPLRQQLAVTAYFASVCAATPLQKYGDAQQRDLNILRHRRNRRRAREGMLSARRCWPARENRRDPAATDQSGRSQPRFSSSSPILLCIPAAG